MSAPQYPDDIGTILQEHERRLADLERGARVPGVTSSGTGSRGIQYADVDLEQSTTSTATTDLTTDGPVVTVVVGKTGRALVQAGAYVTCTVTNQSAYIEVWVKYGGQPSFQYADTIAQLGNNSSGAISANIAGSILPNLGPGTHQLKLRYAQSLAGSTARFAQRWITAQPY